ncbi:hypothetical protein SAMN05421805_102298 [Saccharopolyspora antimicrobica]|uniref:Sporulation and spore germination n=1 Tax=Saccharopolyspora antimicrobica TaxID=455193 RepID=A0A1I4VP68_9PSEU|nr:hypothetical protein [Saccharopolyspora antimicrobica]RKT87286.1 hypothetical protein ATL45_5689 [Saccharopolyspora antimicrobica]SFN02940.1 hypothetical protein SAMN05421805_102298 [Saccharopolyspora antimicrobica]
MKRIWLAAAVLLLAGCGVQPTEVTAGRPAPTGVAPGVTLYFVDSRGELRPNLRLTERLGTISEAMSLLLTGPGGSDLHTEIAAIGVTRVQVVTTPGLIQLGVPLTIDEVTPRGIDQLVCTALGVHVQSGGSRSAKVQVHFVQPTPESDERRTCPLIR